MAKIKNTFDIKNIFVPIEGLEPPRLSATVSKTALSTFQHIGKMRGDYKNRTYIIWFEAKYPIH